MPPRNVVNFMRSRGVEITAKQVQNIYDEKGYPSALDAHELVNRLEEKGNKHGWYTHVVKDDTGKLSHVFWMIFCTERRLLWLARPCLLDECRAICYCPVLPISNPP